MSTNATSDDQGGGLLSGLLAPLRLPERVLEALDGLAESVRDLAPIRTELTRIREQTEPLAELHAALERLNEDLGARLDGLRGVVAELESDNSHLNRSTGELGAKVGALHDVLAPLDERLATIERTTGELAGEVKGIHETLAGVKDDIQRTTGLRGERGLMERARDTLTGGD